MKHIKLILANASLLFISILSSCNNGSFANKPSIPSDTPYLDTNNKILDFSNGITNEIEISQGYSSRGIVNVTWNKENVSFSDNLLHLYITPNKENVGGTAYFGSQCRTSELYSYGDYGISLKNLNEVGTKTSFFTYIGNDDNLAREGIEIIFSGSDPDTVVFNYYLKGNGEHRYSYDLNFDSSKDFHNYGFRWTKDNIIYFVDDKPVYITNKSPSNKARIYMNNYTESNSIIGWIDKPSEEIKNDALIEWVSYKKLD